MNTGHHPSTAWLMDFAAGNTPPLFDAILRAHASTCASCREEIAFAERLGGEFMAASAARSGTLTADDIVDRYEQVADAAGADTVLRADIAALDGNVEQLVATYLGSSLDALRWQRLGGSLRICRLAQHGAIRMWMLRGEPGTVLPEHTHRGSELTLVLKGAYFCGSTIYRAGDIEEADESTRHQPVITRDGECICLAVTEGRLALRPWLPRLVQPFVGI